jgi:catechol-2,3-dioxygenase
MIGIRRLNHAVLYVVDLHAMANFYERLFGFFVVEAFEDSARFLRLPASSNHHDLGLIRIDAPPPDRDRGAAPGLYHLAWQLDDVEQLADARRQLLSAGALVGESEHGTSLSLYGKDPEGNEFEVFWEMPADKWQDREFGVRPLVLEEEIAYWSSAGR